MRPGGPIEIEFLPPDSPRTPAPPSARFLPIHLDRKAWLGIAGVALLALVVFLGFVHIVQSDKGLMVIPKIHWTLAETFVDLDVILGTPEVVAETRWPLAIMALQQARVPMTTKQQDIDQAAAEQAAQESYREEAAQEKAAAAAAASAQDAAQQRAKMQAQLEAVEAIHRANDQRAAQEARAAQQRDAKAREAAWLTRNRPASH